MVGVEQCYVGGGDKGAEGGGGIDVVKNVGDGDLKILHSGDGLQEKLMTPYGGCVVLVMRKEWLHEVTSHDFYSTSRRDVEARITGRAYAQLKHEFMETASRMSLLQFFVVAQHVYPQA